MTVSGQGFPSPLIAHITTQREWDGACAAGRYEPASLAELGFIHFSEPRQVLAVANTVFSGVKNLVVLCARADRLQAPVKYEPANWEGNDSHISTAG